MKLSFTFRICCALIALFFIASAAVQAQYAPELFEAMKARSIGPAGMSGRIGDIEAVVSNPNIIFVGAATGGLWRSVNGGLTWEPLFDDKPVSSIGSVAVFQANPSIVWVGTGEGNPRNSVGVGNGAFKSLDGGDTWRFIGLENTEKIHRLVLHPTDPDIAYAGALGTTWGENPERGVYKTVDGGVTWKKVLYVDDKTGCADLVMDPRNPNKLFAAMWQHRRWPWFFKSGGPGSGIFITHDGGAHWKKLTEKEGIPRGDMGRTGLAIARNNPDIIYALVEAETSALYRSEDGGTSWRIVNDSRGVNPRPFYYADIRVDPENENRVYSLHSRLTISEDGGKSFQSIRSNVHSDHHALWINPENGSFLIDGNDGGIAISYDRGKTWRFVENLPLAQFYHINVDMEVPYNIYGGLQDNGSWRGPSDVWENGGIKNYMWHEVGFGDGFATLSDPTDANSGYCMSQGGNLMRFNVITGERKTIRPPAPVDTVKLRFNWNAAIALDPFAPHTVYYGSQFLHKSTDRGESWTVISPDLTTNDPEKQKQEQSGGLTIDATGAENHTTIITIAPSPVQSGVIWVGTDDGQVQVTRDGGASWTNVTENIPKLAPNTWCPHIEASKFEAGTAYAVFDDHRRSDWTTYIYKTENFGAEWKSLAENDPAEYEGKTSTEKWGFAHVLEQDPVKKELLYLGTEFGLYVSFDDGDHWMKWTHGVPTAPVRALLVHPRDHDLVIGTHGRAAYVLDDIRPLREISEELLKKPVFLFEIADAYQHEIKAQNGYHFPADAYFAGESKPYGAIISYYVNPSEEKETAQKDEEASSERRERRAGAKIEILNAEGEVIRNLAGPAEEGINRISWRLRRDGFGSSRAEQRPGRSAPAGPEILPGAYTVRVSFGDFRATGSVEVMPDPRIAIPMADRREKYEAIISVNERMQVVAEASEQLDKMGTTLDTVMEMIKAAENESFKDLQQAAEGLKKELERVGALFGVRFDGQYRRGEDNVSRKFSVASRTLSSSWDKPNPTELQLMREAERALEEALVEYNTFFAENVAVFREKVEESDLSHFFDVETLDINWKPKKEK